MASDNQMRELTQIFYIIFAGVTLIILFFTRGSHMASG